MGQRGQPLLCEATGVLAPVHPAQGGALLAPGFKAGPASACPAVLGGGLCCRWGSRTKWL